MSSALGAELPLGPAATALAAAALAAAAAAATGARLPGGPAATGADEGPVGEISFELKAWLQHEKTEKGLLNTVRRVIKNAGWHDSHPKGSDELSRACDCTGKTWNIWIFGARVTWRAHFLAKGNNSTGFSSALVGLHYL